MLTIPERYKQNMKAPVKSMRARLVETTENGLSFQSGDDLISTKINAIGEFLGTGAKKITAVLIGEKTTLKDKTFKLELGMEDPATGEIDWCNEGEFIIKEVSISVEKGTTEVIGYDLMAVAQMTDYSNSLLSFPCTIKNLIEQIANKLGLTVGNLDNLANINYTIKEDLYKKINGMNYRQIIDEVAKATGTTAVIRGKELIFKGFIEPTEKLNTSNMLSFKVGEDWGLPTKLVIGREPQGDNVLLEDKSIELEPKTKNMLNLTDLNKVFSSPASILKKLGENEIELTSNGTHGPLTSYNLRVKNITAGKYIFGAKCEGENLLTGQKDVLLCNINRRTKVGAREAYWEMNWGRANIGEWKFVVFTITQEQLDAENWFDVAFYAIGRYPNIKQNCKYSDIILAKFDEGGNNTYVPYIPNGSETIKITNNEILDDDRQELITPLFNSLVKPKNIKMSEIEVSTEGHGIYEVGDVIKCEVGGQSYNLFVNEIKLDITGGLKETLVCHVPKFTETNFLTAGGIVKTLYNTEIKTDKQQQEITAIVSKQEATDKDNQTQFTQLHQDIHNITQTVQTIGGGNLIKNSVGYGKDDSGKISEWTYDKDHTTITSSVSQNSVALGALSGYQLNLSNGDKMSQRIAVSSGQPHTISFKAFKKATGGGAITIKNDLGSKEIVLKEQEELNWDEQVLTFTPTMSWIDVEIKTNANSSISITDLMLAGGDSKQPWRQASGEIYNTQVSVDARGMQVRSSVYDGDYVEITPIEFVGYSSVSGKKKRVFSLNRDITEVEKLNARTQIQMPPMKIVPIDTDNYSGWAFVGLN